MFTDGARPRDVVEVAARHGAFGELSQRRSGREPVRRTFGSHHHDPATPSGHEPLCAHRARVVRLVAPEDARAQVEHPPLAGAGATDAQRQRRGAGDQMLSRAFAAVNAGGDDKRSLVRIAFLMAAAQADHSVADGQERLLGARV